MINSCKGCQTPLGAAACPLHGAHTSNDLICGTCGYRGPASAHQCGTEPLKLINSLRQRVEKLEAFVDSLPTALPIQVTAPSVPSHEGNGKLKDLAEAWRGYKNKIDPGTLEKRAIAWGRLKRILDAVEESALGS